MTSSQIFVPEDGAAPRARRALRWSGWAERLVVAAFVSLVVLRVFVLEPVRVPSASIAPTLLPGDHVLTQTLHIDPGAPLRGALVTFRAPRSGVLTLKRIAGVSGDLVEIRDGVLYVNDRATVEPYVDPRTVDSDYFGPVHVPGGSVFVLGDNRANSEDSRSFGPVPNANLVGRVLVRLWPPSRAGVITWGQSVSADHGTDRSRAHHRPSSAAPARNALYRTSL